VEFKVVASAWIAASISTKIVNSDPLYFSNMYSMLERDLYLLTYAGLFVFTFLNVIIIIILTVG
jgi:hypothetical protein